MILSVPWRSTLGVRPAMTAVVCVVVLSAGAAAASTSSDSLRTYQAPPVLVEGEAWRQPPVPMAVTTIEPHDLERPGVLRLADALRPVVGVRVARYGGVGAFTPISIRGSSNEQVVVLVDGRRLTDAQGGGVDLGGFDTAAIERVDVVRGAATALHGADALGGVVSVITRPRADRLTTGVRLEAGSYATVRGAVDVSGPVGDGFAIWLRAHGLTTHGDYTYEDPHQQQRVPLENGELFARGLSLGVRRTSRRDEWTFDGAASASDQGVAGTVEFPTPNAERADRSQALSFDWQRHGVFGVDSRTEIQAYLHRRHRAYVDPDRRIDDQHRNLATGVDGSTELAPTRGQRYAFGVSGRRDELESTVDGDWQRHSGAVYGRVHWSREADSELTFGGAVRVDAVEAFAPFTSVRLGMAWRLASGRSLRIGAGTAYRPPSFSDLFANDVGFAVIGRELRPERALEIDGGVEQPLAPRGPLSDMLLKAAVFWTSTEDLIQWVPGADGVWRPHNISLATTRGVELEGRATLRAWRRPLTLTANANLLDARNRSGAPNVHGRRLIYRPRFRANLQVESAVHRRLNCGALWQLTGASFITPSNTKAVPGYATLDLYAELATGSQTVLTASVVNLTDRRAIDVRDYPLPGREWRLGFRLAPALAEAER